MIQIRISEPIREYSDHNMSKEPTNPPWERIRQLIWCITCKQAVRGALAVGQEKEGELAITSLEFEYLHRKIDAKCWLAEMTLVMMSLPLACVFQYLFTFALFPLRTDRRSDWLTAQLTWSHRGIEGGIQIPETWWQALLPFSTQPPKRPGELAFRLFDVPWLEWSQIMFLIWVILKECTQCIS